MARGLVPDKRRKAVPYPFVLDVLDGLATETRSMS
jgi:hypothetical protein